MCSTYDSDIVSNDSIQVLLLIHSMICNVLICSMISLAISYVLYSNLYCHPCLITYAFTYDSITFAVIYALITYAFTYDSITFAVIYALITYAFTYDSITYALITYAFTYDSITYAFNLCFD